MSGLFGVAIIGSGIFVKEEHLPAVQACEHLELKAIYSRSLKSATGVSQGLSHVDLCSDDSDKGYKDILSRSDINGVIIVLPITVQPEFIKQALSAGKHVFAEKPLAKDVATGKELVDWYHANIDTEKVTFGIAEQYRYLNAFIYGAEQVRSLGKVLGFRHRLQTNLSKGSSEDGEDERVYAAAAAAFTSVDTVDATFKLANGSTGVYSVSFGTTFSGSEWSVACEKGSVSIAGKNVTVRPVDGEEKTVEKPDELGGVKQEVFAWAKSIVEGKQQPQQKPEEALADFDVVEAMLKSGENGGRPVELKYQI